MGTLPRPLLAVLVAVIAAFAAWTVVLKPKSSNSGASNAQVTQAVHQAIGQLHRSPATKTTRSKGAANAHVAPSVKTETTRRQAQLTAAKQASAARRRIDQVTAALSSGKVVALLFFNPAGADDQADLKQLAAIPSHGGKVVKVGVPVSDLARYSAVTDQVPVQGSPTLVVIDRGHKATTLVGFADQLEMNQLVAGALAAK